jgi:hypothetical protein
MSPPPSVEARDEQLAGWKMPDGKSSAVQAKYGAGVPGPDFPTAKTEAHVRPPFYRGTWRARGAARVEIWAGKSVDTHGGRTWAERARRGGSSVAPRLPEAFHCQPEFGARTCLLNYPPGRPSVASPVASSIVSTWRVCRTAPGARHASGPFISIGPAWPPTQLSLGFLPTPPYRFSWISTRIGAAPAR